MSDTSETLSARMAEVRMRQSSSGFRGLSLRVVLLVSLLAIVIATLVLVSLSVLGIMREAAERERLNTAGLLAAEAASDPKALDAWTGNQLIVGWWRFEVERDELLNRLEQENTEGRMNVPAARELSERAQTGSGPVAKIVSDGEGRLALAAASGPGRGESVVVALSMKRLDKQLSSAQGLVLLYLILVGLTVTVFGYWLLTRSVVRPVNRLARATERVAEGDLDARIRGGGSGELARLAERFNDMVKALKSSRDQQAESLGELERTYDELQSAYEELEVTRDGLVRSEKLASVGRLSAGVAHEIGNPLSSILAYLELLRDEDTTADESEAYLKQVEDSTRRIHSIIRELLDYSRASVPDVTSLDPAQAIDLAVRLVKPQPRFRDVDLQVEVGDGPDVQADESRLVQILVNLLLNAADAVDGEGEVRVGLEYHEDQAQIVVSDNGPGIDEDELPHIFEPFYTTKEPGEGTGLGLAISERLAEALGGSLTAMNREDGGARFELTLKASSSEGSAAPEEVPEDARVPAKAEVAVDDDAAGGNDAETREESGEDSDVKATGED